MKQLSSSRKLSTRARRNTWGEGFICWKEQPISTHKQIQRAGWHQRQAVSFQETAFTVIYTCCSFTIWFVKDNAFPCNTSPAWNFTAVLWAVPSLGLQPPSLWLKSVEISPASLGTGWAQTQSSFSRADVLFHSDISSAFAKSLSAAVQWWLAEVLLSLSCLSFQWPFSGWKGQVSPASSPLTVKNLFFF